MCVVFSFLYFRVPTVCFVAALSDMLKPILVQMKPFTLSDIQSWSECPCLDKLRFSI